MKSLSQYIIKLKALYLFWLRKYGKIIRKLLFVGDEINKKKSIKIQWSEIIEPIWDGEIRFDGNVWAIIYP